MKEINTKQISRARFMEILLLFTGIVSALSWFKAVSRERSIRLPKRRIYLDQNSEASRSDDLIVLPQYNNAEKGPLVFKNKCTHLGCSLDLYPDGQIVCPCHGSAFDSKGKVLRGPARKDLELLDILFDEERKQWFVVI